VNASTFAVSTLQQTIARAIERFPRERARIERAATLIALGHVSQVSADAFAVRSQTDSAVTYTVAGCTYASKATGCECIDAKRHPGQSCKHAWAVDLVQVAEDRQRRLDAAASAARFPLLSAAEMARLSAWKQRQQTAA
jgi:hypothetical protein